MDLLFRRGKLAGLLADDVIKPGTISITTDEPGLYLDLDANEAGDGQPAKRVRVGDFIVATSLQSLKDDALAGKKFSTHALYYSEAENMLMRYNGSTFVWINSYEDVKADVTALKSDMSTAQGDISNTSAALTQEIKDRAAADKSLQDQIDAIQGTTEDGVSLTSLKEALDAEIAARSTKDNELVGEISTINGTLSEYGVSISGNTDAIAAINTRLGYLPSSAGDTTIVQYFTDKIAAEETRAKAAEAANAAAAKAADDRVAAEEGTRATEVTRLTGLINTAQQTAQKGVDDAAAEKTRAEAAEGELRQGIADANSDIADLRETVATNNGTASSEISGIKERLDTAEKDIDDLQRDLAAEVTNRGNAITGLRDEIIDITDNLQQSVNGLDTSLGQLGGTVENINTNLTKEITNRTEADTALGKRIDNEVSAREQADTTINGRIDGLASTVSGHGTAIAENLAAINENKDAITELGKKDAALQQLIEANTQAIANEVTRADTAEKKIASDLSTAKTQLTDRISEVDGKVDSTATTLRGEMSEMEESITEAYTAADQALLKKINDNIAVANAMTFMGEIDSFDDIPNTGTKAGDMYVVINPDLNTGWNVGDLLVIKEDGLTFASNADKINGVIHVETGYHTFNDARLVANGNKVQLQSHLGRDLGSIEVKAAADSNVTVTLDNVASSSGTGEACAITVGLAWGTF